MINENVAFEKRARVLHIVLTAPPRLSDMRLANALVSYFGFRFTNA